MLKTQPRLRRYEGQRHSKAWQPALERMEARIVLSPPTVTSLAPTSGTEAGGTPVTITGTGFTGATVVDFGTTSASTFSVVNDTTIDVTSPAAATPVSSTSP